MDTLQVVWNYNDYHYVSNLLTAKYRELLKADVRANGAECDRIQSILDKLNAAKDLEDAR